MSVTQAAVMLAIAMTVATATAASPDPHGNVLPTAGEYSTTVLPERNGVLSWKTLGQVTPTQKDGRLVPAFSAEVSKLDKQDVRVQGFMIPVETDLKQKHFVLSAIPPSCPFCLPAGPEAIVEVRLKSGIEYDTKPIIVAGRFSVHVDDPRGVFYVLTDGVAVEE